MEEPLKAENDKESKEDNKDNDVVEVSRSDEHPIGQDLAPANNICEQRTSEECIVTTDADTTTEAGSESEPTKTFQFGSSGGFMFSSGEAVKTDREDNASSFSFGGGNASDNKEVTSGFKFESAKSVQLAMKDTTPGFSFDESDTCVTAATDKNGSTGFKFGVEQVTETEVSGKLTEKNPSPEIVRNLKVPTTSVSATSFGTSNSAPAKKGFQFSDKHKMDSKEDMSSSDAKTKSKKGIYLSNLKNLNIQVTAWIKCHVDTNPLIDLTPVFKDYEKHIGALKNKIQASTSFSTTPSALTTTTFGSTNSSFGSGSGFGFLKNCEKEQESTEKESDDGGEDPVETSSPHNPAEPVVEKDALYTKKCKLFYKKGDGYVERGLGNLHLKLTECGRLQLVVRASTSLGNILLNILVTAATPLERLGANNVMLVSVPNPPLDKKTEEQTPVTFLIRVKTGIDADELKQKISDLCKTE